jgi:hypothetical protein
MLSFGIFLLHCRISFFSLLYWHSTVLGRCLLLRCHATPWDTVSRIVVGYLVLFRCRTYMKASVFGCGSKLKTFQTNSQFEVEGVWRHQNKILAPTMPLIAFLSTLHMAARWQENGLLLGRSDSQKSEPVGKSLGNKHPSPITNA